MGLQAVSLTAYRPQAVGLQAHRLTMACGPNVKPIAYSLWPAGYRYAGLKAMQAVGHVGLYSPLAFRPAGQKNSPYCQKKYVQAKKIAHRQATGCGPGLCILSLCLLGP